MDPVDKLLADLKTEAKPQVPVRPAVPSASEEAVVKLSPAAPGDALDDLLDHLAEPTPRSVRADRSPPPPVQSQCPAPVWPASTAADRSPENALLADMKADYEARDRAAALKQQQERQQAEQQQQQQAVAKQKRLDQLKQQRRAELSAQAAAWLKTINPKTEEGLWFEEFACGYESRLEAAIDYLDALQEAERNR